MIWIQIDADEIDKLGKLYFDEDKYIYNMLHYKFDTV